MVQAPKSFLAISRCLLAQAAILASFHSVAVAQVPDGSGRTQVLENQLRPLIAPQLLGPPIEEGLLIDHGAVLRSQTAFYEDSANDNSSLVYRNLHIAEVRPWAMMSYGELHRGFIRGQLGYQTYGVGDGYDTGLDEDTQGPYVDQGYYQLDVDALARRAGIANDDGFSSDFTIGRQFLVLGQGVTYGLTAETLSLDWNYGAWRGLAFGGQTIDRNVVGQFGNRNRLAYQLDRRRVYGGQLEYQGLDHQELYSYVLGQWDNVSGIDATANAYDSTYWGIGASGEVLFGEPGQEIGIPNLRFHTEFIVQSGQHQEGLRRSDISAWAFDSSLDYFFTVPGRPRVGFKYSHASGDNSRAGGPQPSGGTNEPGTKDSTFAGFGYVNTGISFAPLFSNLELVRLSAAMRPFDDPDSPAWQNLEVGTSMFFYWRAAADAQVSNAGADTPGDSYLGHEWDVHLNWRLSSDLFLLLNYGVFFPHGGSFSPLGENDHSRQFLTVNLNWLL